MSNYQFVTFLNVKGFSWTVVKEIYKKYDLGAIFASVVVANKIRTGRMGIKLEEIE